MGTKKHLSLNFFHLTLISHMSFYIWQMFNVNLMKIVKCEMKNISTLGVAYENF